jgi:hypothetical protein
MLKFRYFLTKFKNLNIENEKLKNENENFKKNNEIISNTNKEYKKIIETLEIEIKNNENLIKTNFELKKKIETLEIENKKIDNLKNGKNEINNIKIEKNNGNNIVFNNDLCMGIDITKYDESIKYLIEKNKIFENEIKNNFIFSNGCNLKKEKERLSLCNSCFELKTKIQKNLKKFSNLTNEKIIKNKNIENINFLKKKIEILEKEYSENIVLIKKLFDNNFIKLINENNEQKLIFLNNSIKLLNDKDFTDSFFYFYLQNVLKNLINSKSNSNKWDDEIKQFFSEKIIKLFNGVPNKIENDKI